MLDFLHAKLDCCLVIDGESLQVISIIIITDLSFVSTHSVKNSSYWQRSSRPSWLVAVRLHKRPMWRDSSESTANVLCVALETGETTSA